MKQLFSCVIYSIGHDTATSVVGTSVGTAVPIPKFDHPSHALLRENGFRQMKYEKYHEKCLHDKQLKGGCVGASYQRCSCTSSRMQCKCFWPYFLPFIDNFMALPSAHWNTKKAQWIVP